jgi:quinol monooxygenase YgiN
MSFIQIIEVRTKKIDELQALDAQWEQATEGKRTLRRSIIGRDRDDPERYLIFAFFDSYESAMENSKLPETGAFAEKQMPLLDGSPVFHDLDIIDDRP